MCKCSRFLCAFFGSKKRLHRCAYNATRYKRLAKAVFFVNIMLGIAVLVLTIFRQDIDSGNSWGQLCNASSPVTNSSQIEEDGGAFITAQTGIFVLATLLTLLTGINTFLSPSQRWRELRAVAEILQSEIFQFRTRMGPYKVVSAAAPLRLLPRSKEELLHRHLQTHTDRRSTSSTAFKSQESRSFSWPR